MALLEKLQRSRWLQSKELEQVVITRDRSQIVDSRASQISGRDTESVKELDGIVGTATDTERLLEDLLRESGKTASHSVEIGTSSHRRPRRRGSTGSLKRPPIVRRSSGGATSRMSRMIGQGLPGWLGEQRKVPAHVEAIISLSVKSLLTSLKEQHSAGIMELVAKTVQGSVKELSGELRFTRRDTEVATREVEKLARGIGPLEPLVDDTAVSDIFIDGHQSIKVLRKGLTIETPFRFRTADEYQLYLLSLLRESGEELNSEHPIVDLIREDENRSRVNILDESLVEGDEPRICIRIPRPQKLSFYDILQTRTLPPVVASWLAELVAMREANVLVVGPQGSGKTAMTTALLSAVSSDERIIALEEVPEISVPTSNLEKLILRPGGEKGGNVGVEELFRVALRRSPHRLVLGDINGPEGALFLRALGVGYTGSIATLHAETVLDGLWMFVDLVSAQERSPLESILRRVARSIHIVVTMRQVDGTPCLSEISEIQPPENGEFIARTILKFEGVVDGRRVWRLGATQSRWIDRLAEMGSVLQEGAQLLPPLSGESIATTSGGTKDGK